MRLSVERVRTLSRFAVIAMIGGIAAGCSADSMRFAGGPFSNPFASKGQGEPRMTGSVPATPRTAIRSQPLAAPQPKIVASAPLPSPVYAAPRSAAVSAPAHRQAPASTGPGGWTAAGGTWVTVGPGENLNVIANRYGVPAAAIISTNNLSSAAQATPGRQVIIPVYNASGAQVAAAQPAAPQAQAKSHLAAPAKPAPSLVKQAEAPKQHVRPGQVAAQSQPASIQRPAEPVKVARAEVQPAAQPAAQPKISAPAPKQEAAQPVKEPEQTASLPSGNSADFRWPARGRVISGFGGAASNEGINIAVPEGTPVKAAEAGTVAYAGSEVKGYGNLVLIRHDNGFVSAYAHNGEISVKRGDKVKRGQVVAKSGQSGNVTSPQLHFEIRKGSTPVDPIPHLGG
jgi:murein DD-endopeptidase MepM/ murein hydrolase activator NlpD